MDILDELYEYVTLRLHICNEVKHSRHWAEYKSHSNYDLWLITKGTVHIRAGDSDHIAKEGDAVFFYPHVPYSARTDTNGCRFIYLIFDFELGNNSRILNGFDLCGVIPGGNIQEEIAQISSIYFHSLASPFLREMRLKGALILMLAKVFSLYRSGTYVGEIQKGGKSSSEARQLKIIQPVFKYIQKNVHSKLTMSELAEVACLSEKYFITSFKQVLGITPGQYIYQLRMNLARNYLIEGHHTIKEIATRLGYPNPYSFSKAFKKRFDIPPSQF